MNEDDARLLDEVAEELATQAPLEVVYSPVSMFQLAGLIQLALRHPGVDGNVRATAAKFLDGTRAYFADCPAVLDVLRRGDDPAEDR